jgi:hypothetical protein
MFTAALFGLWKTGNSVPSRETHNDLSFQPPAAGDLFLATTDNRIGTDMVGNGTHPVASEHIPHPRVCQLQPAGALDKAAV